ncbi:MAG: hypothetical protein VX119_05335 [Bacteroidota bacterium]|nr:hypothetical protein [Bacteroidota bacterium]MEC9221921.1 hypothetical protein [Bacteroidota bacterium]
MKHLTTMVIATLTLVSCSSEWSEEAKSIYRDSCAVSPELEEYCECTLEKVMEASPNPADVGNLDMEAIGAQCIHLLGWSEADKSSYMESCVESPDMEDYCQCTLDKIIEASPNPADVGNVDIATITEECIDLMPGMEDYYDLMRE